MSETAYQPNAARQKSTNLVRRILGHENAILAIVLVILTVAMGAATAWKTVTRANIQNVLIQSSTRGVASIGQAFVILTGGIDVSIGGVGLSATILGSSLMTGDMSLNIAHHAMPLAVGLLVMVMAGAAWGALNGTLVSRIGIPPLIVTLGMWQIAQGLAFRICSGYTLFDLPKGIAFFGQGAIGGVPVPAIIFIAVSVVAYLVLMHTTYGRSIYAIGGNQASAWLSGIRVKPLLLSVYIIAGALAGLAGIITTGRVVTASMVSLGGLEIDSIAAATVGGVSLAGGRGNIIGVVLGTIIIGVVNNAMSILGADPSVQGAAKGIIIIAAVAADYLRRR